MLKLNPTTYKQEVKTDKRDELFVEIGDSKDLSKFQPQMKICRWGNNDGTNECNVSIRLIEDKDELKETATIVEEAGKIKHIKSKRECHFYNLPISEEHSEGASEFEVILKSDPRKNKGEDYTLEFSLEDKDVDYFYQPALTSKEIAEGADRPENVIGSYAIYAKTPKTNWTGGKEYKCGKVGHIYRPKNIDAVGKESWGILNIDTVEKKLRVTILADFLDKAVYPVRHAAGLTFGYQGTGGTEESTGVNAFIGSLFTGASGTVSSLSAYCVGRSLSFYGTEHWKGIIIKHSDLSLISGGVGSIVDVAYNAAADWRTSTLTPDINAEDYILGVIGGSGNAYTTFYYDTGSANQGHAEGNNYATPTGLSSPTHSTKRYFIYATYTAGGGETVVKDLIQSGIIAFPR